MAAIALPTQTTVQTSQNLLAASGRRIYTGLVSLPNSYNTGGYTVADSQFGLVKMSTLISGTFISSGHPLCLVPVISAGFLVGFTVYDLSTGAEAISGLDCSQMPVYVMIWGN